MHLLKRFVGRLAAVLPGGGSFRPACQRWRGVHIGRNVWIAQGVYFDELYPEAITIADNCTIGLRTSVFGHFHWGGRRSSGGFRPVTLERDVFVGPHCVILPGVRVGEGSVIKAGSVLTRSVPAHVMWADGGPRALVTVPLTREHSYEEFLAGLRPLASRARTRSRRVSAAPPAD